MSHEERFKELRMFSLEKRKIRRDVHESYLKLSEELSWERWVRFISKAKRAGLGLISSSGFNSRNIKLEA